MTTSRERRGKRLVQQLYWEARPRTELLRLTWPISVAMLSFTAMALVDTAFVGTIGKHALAGVGLSLSLVDTLVLFGLGALQGVKLLVSQAFGAGLRRRVLHYAAAGHLMAILLGLAVVAVGLLAARAVPLLAGSPEAGEAATSYLSIRILGAPLLYLYTSAREVSCGVGDSRSTMHASVGANLVNAVLDYLFVIEFSWGVEGAAIASVIAGGVEMAAMIRLSRGRGFGQLRRGLRYLGSVWRTGAVIGLQFAAEMAAVLIVAILVSTMNPTQMAAHHVVLLVGFVALRQLRAIGEAVSVMVGHAVGANRDDAIGGLLRVGLGIALLFGAFVIAVAGLAATSILSLLTRDASVVEAALVPLQIVAVMQIPTAISVVVRGVLRGVGDLKFPTTLSLVASWVILPPVTWWLGHRVGLGAVGAWLAFAAFETVVATGSCWRLWSGSWRVHAERGRAALKGQSD